MTKYKNVGGASIEMTAEEVTELEAQQAKVAIKVKSDIDAITQKKVDKATGNQKLKDLGLTDDEITALIS